MRCEAVDDGEPGHNSFALMACRHACAARMLRQVGIAVAHDQTRHVAELGGACLSIGVIQTPGPTSNKNSEQRLCSAYRLVSTDVDGWLITS